MTALNAFLFGMPILLIVGGAVTLALAKRAAAEIRNHETPKPIVVTQTGAHSGRTYTANVAKILNGARPHAKVG